MGKRSVITITPQISSRPNKEKLHRIEFRITINGQHSYVGTNEWIQKVHWSKNKKTVKEGNLCHKVINQFVEDKLKEFHELRRTLSEDTEITAIEFKNLFLRPDKEEEMSFIKFFEKVIERLESIPRSRRTAQSYSVVLSKIKSFTKGKNVNMKDLTLTFVEDFESYIRRTIKTVRGDCDNTVAGSLKVLRAIVNRAIKEKLFNQADYPFGTNGKKIVWKKRKKDPLTKEEIDKLSLLELNVNSMMFHARNIFVFQFYGSGMRIEDALKLEWSEVYFSENVIRYSTGKTGKVMVSPILPVMQQLLNHYKNLGKSQYVFPFLTEDFHINENTIEYKDRIKDLTAHVNNNLNKLRKRAQFTKRMSTHIARHSYANYAMDQNLKKFNDPKTESIGVSLGHSSVLVTKNYLIDLPAHHAGTSASETFRDDNSAITL